MCSTFTEAKILQVEITGYGALPVPGQIMRPSWRQARVAAVRGRPFKLACPCQQRSLGLLQSQQAISQVAGHPRFHQRVTQGGCGKQA
ncbi:hypothetical protein D3C81_1859330 [compost metagenome]